MRLTEKNRCSYIPEAEGKFSMIVMKKGTLLRRSGFVTPTGTFAEFRSSAANDGAEKHYGAAYKPAPAYIFDNVDCSP
ncbi:MAG: hypothetical protein GY862_15155 [Gammaproteobacteria bacterium]|nr:hypothetical protein [Gammaproteobacteria bacterium]